MTENITLDGIIAPMDGWFDPTAATPDLLDTNRKHREAADALVVGRVTYGEFAGFWPLQKDDQTGITDYLNQVDKYVVSTTLERAEWVNTTILRGAAAAAIETLKQQPGKDITITGSASLVRSLVPTGLIDVYRLFVYPVVQGHGRRLFPDGASVGLELTETCTYSSGVVLLEYRSTGRAATVME